MSEGAPAAPEAQLPAVKGPGAGGKRTTAAAANATRKASGPSVTELLTQAVAASKERGGVSLAALKKSLAAAGYDVEKNNSRIKLGLRSLVSKGTLVQTKGTGASGSFKLNRKQVEAKDKAARKKQSAAAKAKKPVAKKPASAAKKAKAAAGAKKGVKKVTKKAASAGARKGAAKSPKKPKVVKAKKGVKSPAKARVAKPKAKPKTPKAKVVKPKKVAPKKK